MTNCVKLHVVDGEEEHDIQIDKASWGIVQKLISPSILTSEVMNIVRSKCNVDGVYSDYLTEIVKLTAYLTDISNDHSNLLDSIKSTTTGKSFIDFMHDNHLQRNSIFDFINRIHNIDVMCSKHTSDVWTKMRPVSDIGKTRGYSGPAELPLILLCGGEKAERGDIKIDESIIEVKGEGGRIGTSSSWTTCKREINNFTNPKNTCLPHSDVQLELDLGCDETSVANTLQSCDQIPLPVRSILNSALSAEIIKTRTDRINALGVIQLMEYVVERQDDWFMLIKHPGKPTAPIGTVFILKCEEVKIDYKSFIDIFNAVKANHIKFAKCFDTGGFKIKFAK